MMPRPVVDSRHIGVLSGVGHGHFAFPGPDDFNEYVYPYETIVLDRVSSCGTNAVSTAM